MSRSAQSRQSVGMRTSSLAVLLFGPVPAKLINRIVPETETENTYTTHNKHQPCMSRRLGT